MKNVEIKLRAHHGMCLAFFEGKGYSAGFTAHMAQILEYLEQENPTVTVVAEADCICGGCPHLANGICESADLVQSYDRQVLSLCDMEEHSVLPWREFAARIYSFPRKAERNLRRVSMEQHLQRKRGSVPSVISMVG